MPPFLVIARLTVQESSRRRLLLALVILTLIVVGFSAWGFNKITTVTGLGKGDMSWKYFLKVVETNDGFLFYPLKNLFHWIPVTAFASADCMEQLRNLIRKNAIALVDKRTKR